MVGLSLGTAVLGIWWVISSHSWPSGDSLPIVDRAHHILKGEYYVLRETDYFRIYPFQTGYLLYSELAFRIFGNMNLDAMGILNVVWVLCAYWGVFFITRELFNDARIELLTVIFLALSAQPVFLCTFLYGTIPGLSLAVWSLYFVIRFLKNGTALSLLPAALLVAVALTLKKNFSIFMIAECILLLVSLLKKQRILAVACVAVMLALSLIFPAAVKKNYEQRLDTEFGKGTPLVAWLVTGFRESSLCSGWYSSYTGNMLRDHNYNVEQAEAQAWKDFFEQVDMFAHRPRYFAAFFFHKITSQWCEPLFQSTWASASCGRTEPVTPLIESIGNGPINAWLMQYFNLWMQYVYIALAAGLFLLARRGHGTDAQMIVPLIFIGAFVYHTLFEAKSQYALIYVPLMLPYAAYATVWLSDRLAKRRTKAVSAAKAEPEPNEKAE